MSSEQLSAVIDALARPDNQAALPDEAALDAIKARVADIVTPALSAGPPSDDRAPLPELRALGAPKHLDWKELRSFPVLLGEVRSIQREWEVQTRQNRLFLLSNLDSGAVDVIAPLDHGRRMPNLPPSHSGSPPDASNAVLSIIGVLPFDLLRWFTPQQMQGRLAVTALDFDRVSNTVRVDVSGGPGSLPAPALRAAATSRPSPSSPDAIAMGSRVQWPATLGQGEAARVQVELKLPRDRVALVASQAGAEPALAASLLMLQLDKSPVLAHVRSEVTQGDGWVAAAFDVDLGRGLAGALDAGEWLGYLIVGQAVIGPHRFSVKAP